MASHRASTARNSKFVRTEMGWTTRRWRPSTMALIPVVYFFAKHGPGKLRASDASLVKRYLLIAVLRSLFRGSGETVVNTYVNAIRKAGDNRTGWAKALLNAFPRIGSIRSREMTFAPRLACIPQSCRFILLISVATVLAVGQADDY
jgi:hypothetical protein